MQTTIDGVLLLEPKRFGDERGYFMEAFNAARFSEATGCTETFVQDNQSRSRRNVLRGLHYQIGEHPQGKLVRVLSGEVFDVAVDIRSSSPTFGAWTGVHLSATNNRQLWVPAGFAHGFLTLSDSAELLYKVTDFYDPDGERSIIWNDADIGIDWPIDETPILAEKDAAGSALREADVFA